MKFNTNDVKQMLKNFKKSELRIEQLKYELDNFRKISFDDVIDSMSLSSGADRFVTKSRLSDNTAYTALNYTERFFEINKEAKTEILKELSDTVIKRDRLLHYIDLLDDDLSEIIKKLYLGNR